MLISLAWSFSGVIILFLGLSKLMFSAKHSFVIFFLVGALGIGLIFGCFLVEKIKSFDFSAIERSLDRFIRLDLNFIRNFKIKEWFFLLTAWGFVVILGNILLRVNVTFAGLFEITLAVSMFTASYNFWKETKNFE